MLESRDTYKTVALAIQLETELEWTTTRVQRTLRRAGVLAPMRSTARKILTKAAQNGLLKVEDKPGRRVYYKVI